MEDEFVYNRKTFLILYWFVDILVSKQVEHVEVL